MKGTSTQGGANATVESEICPVCGGRGWIIKADGGAGTAVRCDCAKRERNATYLAQSGIPERYRDCTLSNFNTRSSKRRSADQLLAALRHSERYVDDFIDHDDGRFTDTGLIFIGPPGTGKTHLAAAVLRALIERYGVRGRFVDFTTLLRQIQATFDPATAGNASSVLQPIFHAEVLVLDELGAQKPSDWVLQTLYDIINTRYTGRRPTIFTTNYRFGPETTTDVSSEGSDPETSRSTSVGSRAREPQRNRSRAETTKANPFSHLDARISPSLVSRIHEMARPIRLDVDDYRLRNRPVGRR